MRRAKFTSPSPEAANGRSRRGAATLDYALVIGVIFPLATIVIPASIRMIRAVYEMMATLVAWPFM